MRKYILIIGIVLLSLCAVAFSEIDYTNYWCNKVDGVQYVCLECAAFDNLKDCATYMKETMPGVLGPKPIIPDDTKGWYDYWGHMVDGVPYENIECVVFENLHTCEQYMIENKPRIIGNYFEEVKETERVILFSGTVIAEKGLFIRTDASTDKDPIASLLFGDVVDIYKISRGDVYVWGQLEDFNWVALNYIIR